MRFWLICPGLCLSLLLPFRWLHAGKAATAAVSEKFFRQCATAAELDLLRRWPPVDRSSEGFIAAVLTAEGVSDSGEVARFRNQFAALTAELDGKIKPDHSPRKKSETIFKFLHKSLFKKYVLIARFSGTFATNQYNCVTSTIFFSLLAGRYQVPHTVYLTPNHVFAVVNEPRAITVELTNPQRGFDFRDGQEAYIEYLLEYKLITPAELAEKGAMQIYHEYIEERRPIDPWLLVGVTFANMAAEAGLRRQFDQAVCHIKKALVIDPGYEAYQTRYKYFMAQLITEAPSSYLRYWDTVVQTFALFPEDTVFANKMWEAVRAVFYEVVHLKRDYGQADLLYQRLREFLPTDSRFGDRLSAIHHSIIHAETGALLLRGKYQEAFQRLGVIAPANRQHAWFREMHVDVGTRYAQSRLLAGDLDGALAVLDTLMQAYPEFRALRTTFVDFVLLHVGGALFNRQNYEQSETYLRRAYALAPQDIRLQQGLPMFYHEMAMAKVRAERYAEAKQVVERGLALFPDHKMLHEAHQQILEVIAFERSKNKL